MELQRSDDRKVHLITRGNVDGIVSAALFLARDPRVKVSFVASGDLAVPVLRKDITSKQFYLVDLGLTPRLLKTLNDKTKFGQQITYLDHHEQSMPMLDGLDHRAVGIVQEGLSAAGVAYDHLGLNGKHKHLIAIADKIEYCPTDRMREVADDVGARRLWEEARMLDFSWRFQVEDDRFRLAAARKLSEGRWPSEVNQVRSRYLQMVNEGRWDKALDKVRERIVVKHNVALLRFGRRKTSLNGFGSRALTAVAKELGVGVAVMLTRRNQMSSISMRHTGVGDDQWNMGAFVNEFTATHGIVGGGHPHSAGARIPTKAVPQFLHEVYCFA